MPSNLEKFHLNREFPWGSGEPNSYANDNGVRLLVVQSIRLPRPPGAFDAGEFGLLPRGYEIQSIASNARTATGGSRPARRRISLQLITNSSFTHAPSTGGEGANGLRIAAELRNGAIHQRFIYGEKVNVPDAIVRGGSVYKVFTDSRGSPLYVVNVTDPDDVLLDAEYDVFGKVTSFTSSEKDGNGKSLWPIPFGFAGGLYDADTGFVRFGAREYDPSVGRWTSKDPILFAGGQGNLFVYVNGDPVNLVDPRGLYSWSEFGSDVVDSGIQAARGAWTSPQLVAGLLVGTLGSGVNASVVGGNLEFYNNWVIDAVGTAGLTLGNIIIYSGQNPSVALRLHEQQHVPQSDLLGPLYLPAHILNQGVGEGIMGMPHSATPLECGPSDASNRRPWP